MTSESDINRVLELTGGENILRRYFVMNGFDGALTALGIIIGSLIYNGFKHVSWAADAEAAKNLIFMGVGSSIAMGVSGFWIAYLTERAERTKEIKELEADMLTDLNDTQLARANFKVSWIISAVDGISPFMFSIISLIPFLFVIPEIITMRIAYVISIGLIFIEVFILGVLLGAISKENKILYALKIVPAMLVVALLTLVLELISGREV